MWKKIQKTFLLYLFLATGFFASAEREENIGSFTPARHAVKIKRSALKFKGVRRLWAPSITLRLINNEVDISPLIPALEMVKQSNFDNFSKLEEVTYPEIVEKIGDLCEHSNSPTVCAKKARGEVRQNIDRIHQETDDYIFYPEHYYPLHKSKFDYFKGEVLDSSCLDNCYDRDLVFAVRYNKGGNYSYVYDQIKESGKQCQRNLLSGLAKTLKYNEFPEKCLQEKNKDHAVCKSLSKDVSILKGRISDIAELAYGPDILKTTEAEGICINCATETDKDMSFSMLGDLINNSKKYSVCFDLQPGEIKEVSYCREVLYMSCNSHNIVRELDGNYSVSLNLRFTAGNSYDGSVPREQVPAHYMRKVQQCIDKANTKMLGPNGEKVKISISDRQNKQNTCKSAKEIKIVSSHNRSNAGNYASDIDCPAITHEVLHLLGLCDEYQDNRRYACRVITRNSIMSSHWERWNNTFQNGRNESLLNPAQFNHILYGDCESKNKLLSQCSNLAYKISRDTSDCKKQKQQCEKQNAMVEASETQREKPIRVQPITQPSKQTASASLATAQPSRRTESARPTVAQPRRQTEKTQPKTTSQKRAEAKPPEKTKKGSWSGVVSFLKGETMPTPKLRINGKIKEYPKTQEGWRNYWKDKRRIELENSK